MYLETIYYQHRAFDVKGLSTQGPYNLELEQVFVDLSVETLSHHLNGPLANPIPSKISEFDQRRHTIWEFLVASKSDQNFAIIGPPGSGKTTLLKNIALTLSSRSSRRIKKIPDKLPVLLFLREHASSIDQNPKISLTELVSDYYSTRSSSISAAWLRRQLEAGHCVIMLDGLDEIADPTIRGKISQWIEECAMAYNKNIFMVTSRPHGYQTNPLAGFATLQVCQFNLEQVERFIYNWYLANEIKSHNKNDPGVREESRRGAIHLIESLRSNRQLQELAVNPLLLTMISTVHRYRSSLPSRRVELYAEICEVFLGKRQQARGLTMDLTPAQKMRVLRPLAFYLMKNKIREISIEEAVEIIAGSLESVAKNESGEEFLKNIENTSGLLIEYETGIYGFAHIVFQEYIASTHIVEAQLERELLANVDDLWWRETILLYCGQGDGSSIISRCLELGNATSLRLAIECVDEAREVNPEVRKRFEITLLEAINSEDEGIRTLVTKEAGRIGQATTSDLFIKALQFFRQAGFNCQIQDQDGISYLRCTPEAPEWKSEAWKERLGISIYIQTFENRALNRDDIAGLYKSALFVVGNPSVIIAVVNRSVSISGWDEINALRSAIPSPKMN